jgi:cell wall-associated NlpC family hydrolase
MTEAEERAAIVAEALSWSATPYHERAMIKGVAADCALFPFATYLAVGKIPADTEPPEYSSQSMLHEDREHYLGWVRQYAREIERDAVLPGDFAIFRYGRSYSHGAIVIDLPEVIHAVIRGNGVIIGNIDRDTDLATRKVKFFTLF